MAKNAAAEAPLRTTFKHELMNEFHEIVFNV